MNTGNSGKQQPGWKTMLAIAAMLVMPLSSLAGSDRLIMGMTMENMNRLNLVYVRFIGPAGETLEFEALKKMVVREQDCDTGHRFEMVKDYRAGYFPQNMMIGMYLSPYAWRDRTLCFSVPGVGKVEQKFDPSANGGRAFQLKLAD